MKQLTILIIFSGFLYVAPSCSNEDRKVPDYKKNVIHVECELLQINELVGNPNDIVRIDTLLVYYDFYEEKFLSVFDLKNNNFAGRFLSQGQGPGEAIAPVLILQYPEKDKLYIYQRNMAILSILDFPGLKIQQNIQITSETPWRPFEMQRTKDYYIGLGIFEKGRFAIYDLNGSLIKEVGKHPFKGEDMERTSAFLAYQGPYCTNPENNHFASGSLYSDYIAFYKVIDKEVVTIREYYSRDVNVKYNSNHVSPNNDCVINYTSAFGSKSYCYMLFSGKTYEDNNSSGSGGNYIIVFDWDGNYIKTYETDHKIYKFFVDEANNYIFAKSRDENGDNCIVKIKI